MIDQNGTDDGPTEGDAPPSYPPGSVRALLDTVAVTATTRNALLARLGADGSRLPVYFDEAMFADLDAVCSRLIPQHDRASRIPLAIEIDARLAEGRGNGWRYDTMPEDGEAYRRALHGLNETALTLFGAGFSAIEGSDQDCVLGMLQRGEAQGEAQGEAWRGIQTARVFEELLAEVVETYYAHPLAQEEIGFAGMADAQGWSAIGLGEREAREPTAIGSMVIHHDRG